MLRLLTVVGARPQFIKAAAVSRAIAASNAIRERIVHTGQHYDPNMSQVFFDELAIPPPAHHLGGGGGRHGEQTGLMLARLEAVMLDEQPDCVLVYGDTNSTLAGALAAAKLHIPVAHVEAGLRSFNRRMPEEINRVVTDHVATLLFCPTDAAVENLRREGITRGVYQVGDVMYDSVLFHAAQAERQSRILSRLELAPREYCLATVHRAENTDDPQRLASIFSALNRLPLPVVVPLHPRTRNALQASMPAPSPSQGAGRGEGIPHLLTCSPALLSRAAPAVALPPHVRLIDPLPYLDLLMLEKHARAILTDSGGVQKEACFFGVPCITLRDETEWVELVDAGINVLAGADPERILAAVERLADRPPAPPIAPRLYGNGRAAEELVRMLTTTYPASAVETRAAPQCGPRSP
ncbi:MAG: UDP-N-acetylglucosamine 2-epimerase (non-hydrolyzing) [Phycisphaerae bacterium]|nr:UDP-N-acetylglucosamine 2-epimerase (non-hydrolyzing) [Phycisphaerae bacterium]NUQ46831.1 UDP-N-acetylglucosamine 2-epimerase (non-hydrolyzing) [Phycisphaerae bacterium]